MVCRSVVATILDHATTNHRNHVYYGQPCTHPYNMAAKARQGVRTIAGRLVVPGKRAHDINDRFRQIGDGHKIGELELTQDTN